MEKIEGKKELGKCERLGKTRTQNYRGCCRKFEREEKRVGTQRNWERGEDELVYVDENQLLFM